MVAEARRRLVIVGCASGTGAAGARLLATEGWRLALVDVATEGLGAIARETGAVAEVVADARDPAALVDAVDEGGAARERGRANGRLGRGGCGGGSGSLLRPQRALTLRPGPAHHPSAPRGALLITASNAGLQTDDHPVTYSVTEAAAALAWLLARDRVRVNALCPVYVDMPFKRLIWNNFGCREAFLAGCPVWRRRAGSRRPMRWRVTRVSCSRMRPRSPRSRRSSPTAAS